VADYHSDDESTSSSPSVSDTAVVTPFSPTTTTFKKHRHAYSLGEKIAIIKEINEQTSDVGYIVAVEAVSAKHGILYNTVSN